MNQTTFSAPFGAPQSRASSLLETRELLLRSRLQSMQKTNKQMIINQREQLKTSMNSQ
jgi:hypothetical protein